MRLRIQNTVWFETGIYCDLFHSNVCGIVPMVRLFRHFCLMKIVDHGVAERVAVYQHMITLTG